MPRITDDFQALNDVGWYAAAYLLTVAAFQLFWGKCFTIFPIKPVYLSSIFLFELGSLVCALAPTSPAFIVGRAFAGIAAAGVYGGSNITIAHIAPVAKRPTYTGLLGAAVGIAAIVGPFIGGAFADGVTWRWCFYLNLPIGGLSALVVLLSKALSIPAAERYRSMTWLQRLAQLDILGLLTLTPAVVCLLLAVDWGGQTYAWSNARIIVLFILAGLLGIAFILVQRFTPNTRTVSPSIFKTRSIPFATWYAACKLSLFVAMLYYLPLFFQGVQQVDAFESGIHIMPVLVGFTIFAIVSGILTSVIGYYTPFMILSSIITPIGLGLLTTLNPNSSSGEWIGYQALFGIGVGIGIQQPLMVIQTVLPLEDIPVGTCVVTLVQTLATTIFVAVAQSIFQNRLVANVESSFPGLRAADLLTSSGVSTVAGKLPAAQRPEFLDAYSLSLTQTWYLAVGLGAASIIGSLGTEWKSVKQQEPSRIESQDQTGRSLPP